MDKAKAKHDENLEKIINNLYKIDENVNDVIWIMRDGYFYKRGGPEQHKLCDIVAGRSDFSILLAELKRSSDMRYKAIEQLDSGQYLADQYFSNYTVTDRKIIYYAQGITYENV